MRRCPCQRALVGGQVDWRESNKLLKLEFPVEVRATDAAFDTQFGWLRRPTTVNTSWEVAKYEVCGRARACVCVIVGECG